MEETATAFTWCCVEPGAALSATKRWGAFCELGWSGKVAAADPFGNFFFFFAVLQLHGWPIKNVIISPKDLRLDRRNTWPNNNAHGNLEEVAERNTFREYKKIWAFFFISSVTNWNVVRKHLKIILKVLQLRVEVGTQNKEQWKTIEYANAICIIQLKLALSN